MPSGPNTDISNAQNIFSLAYLGSDRFAYRKILAVLRSLDNVNLMARDLAQTPWCNADALIIDCRRKVHHAHGLELPLDVGKIPKIALTHERRSERHKLFSGGYDDYLLWPIVDLELLRRVTSCIALARLQAGPFKFSPYPLVEHACIYMLENISGTISLESLARTHGTNRNRLTKCFRDSFGMGAMAWLRAQRLHIAMHQIAHSDQRIIDIALSVGYEDANNFSTAFKSANGCSPRAYRNKVRRSKITPRQSKD